MPSYQQLLWDPYPVYRELRERDPVYFSPKWGVWFVTGYDAVASTLRLPNLSAANRVIAR